MSTVEYAHVEINADGVPVIAGTKTKVVEIALDRLAYHWDADEIKRQHPHLTLGKYTLRWLGTTTIRTRWTAKSSRSLTKFNNSRPAPAKLLYVAS